jgi:hypothetical protein
VEGAVAAADNHGLAVRLREHPVRALHPGQQPAAVTVERRVEVARRRGERRGRRERERGEGHSGDRAAAAEAAVQVGCR